MSQYILTGKLEVVNFINFFVTLQFIKMDAAMQMEFGQCKWSIVIRKWSRAIPLIIERDFLEVLFLGCGAFQPLLFKSSLSFISAL